MIIRVQSQDEETDKKVLDALRPLGVEVVTGEENPLVAALFYVARMNTKLDNLGQLKYLYKVHQTFQEFARKFDDVRVYFFNKGEELRAQQRYRMMLYNDLCEATKMFPHKVEGSEHIQRDVIHYTDDQIFGMFFARKPPTIE